jgi:hypothetical protein
MLHTWRVWLCALGLTYFGPCLAAQAQSPGTQSAAAIWVASQGTSALRVGRGVVASQVEHASTLLLPFERDHRFSAKGSSIRHLPHKNLIEITSEGLVDVAFVSDKQVSVTISIKPQIEGESLRLIYAGMKRSVSGCELDGPICFMVKRAIDRHVGDGAQIQAFLDSGLNAALRPVFRAAADVACEGNARPERVRMSSEFLEVLMADSVGRFACPLEAHAALPARNEQEFFKQLEADAPRRSGGAVHGQNAGARRDL